MAAASADGRFDLAEIDLLTTSVGRRLIRETYRTVLASLDFERSFLRPAWRMWDGGAEVRGISGKSPPFTAH